MDNLFPRSLVLPSGEQLLIRQAERLDAAAMIEYVRCVAGETEFLSFGREEWRKTVAEEEAIIQKHADAPNQLFLLALIEAEIVGMLNVTGSPKKRLQHNGEFGLTVKKAFWGKGIGRALMDSLLDWARANPIIRKINLMVMVENERAVRMYRRYGFEVEGRIRRDLNLNGRFHDGYWMGLLID